MPGNVNRVPQALTSKDYQELTKLMLLNNLNGNKEYSYQILHDGKKWYAWYYEDIARRI